MGTKVSKTVCPVCFTIEEPLQGRETYGLPRPELVAIVARVKRVKGVGYRRRTDECTRSARNIGRDNVTDFNGSVNVNANVKCGKHRVSQAAS